MNGKRITGNDIQEFAQYLEHEEKSEATVSKYLMWWGL